MISLLDRGLDDLSPEQFDVTKPFSCCLLCGAVYQSPLDRNGSGGHLEIAYRVRMNWVTEHDQVHTPVEVFEFQQTHRWATPEAQTVLLKFGITNPNARENNVVNLFKSHD